MLQNVLDTMKNGNLKNLSFTIREESVNVANVIKDGETLGIKIKYNGAATRRKKVTAHLFSASV